MNIIIPYYNFGNAPLLLDNHMAAVRKMVAYGHPCITARLTLRDTVVPPMEDVDGHTVLDFTTASVLWHKEALVNATARLLESRGVVADGKILWLDSGCYLTQDAVSCTTALLDSYDFVQPFSSVKMLNPVGEPDASITGYAYGHASGRVPRWYSRVPGGAWAGRLTSFNRMGGLYPYMVVGGGDSAFAHGLIVRKMGLHKIPMAPMLRTHIEKWVTEMQSYGFTYSYAAGAFYHLWHMPQEKRRLIGRHSILQSGNFDPTVDVHLNNGVLEWSRSVVRSKNTMHNRVRDFLLSRQ